MVASGAELGAGLDDMLQARRRHAEQVSRGGQSPAGATEGTQDRGGLGSRGTQTEGGDSRNEGHYGER